MLGLDLLACDVHAYCIDDLQNMEQSFSVCTQNTQTLCNTLKSLGFCINEKKSVLIPSQRVVFFGFIVDSVSFKVFLTDEKIQKIKSKASCLLHAQTVRVRDLASFSGLTVNAFYAILEAPLHYRNMERNKLNV